MSVDSRVFRKALGCFPTGVCVVTSIGSTGQPIGVTVSSFTSVSLDPPLVLFCLDKKTLNLASYRAAGRFVINVLRDDQREVSIQFASKLEDKWKGIDWKLGVNGAPVISHTLAALECVTHEIVEAGDHDIFICRVENLDYNEAGQPLAYFRGAYCDLGCKVP